MYHQIAGIFIGIYLVICTFSYVKVYRIDHRHHFLIHAQQQTIDSSNDTKGIQMARVKKTMMNTFIAAERAERASSNIIHRKEKDGDWYIYL